LISNRLEGEVAAGVVQYLNLRPDFFWFRNNVGGFRPASGGFIKYGKKGSGDYLGCQARKMADGSIWGRFVSIELKREKGGKVSDDQIKFREDVIAHGGVAVVAKSIDEVHAALGEPNVRIPKRPSGRIYPK